MLWNTPYGPLDLFNYTEQGKSRQLRLFPYTHIHRSYTPIHGSKCVPGIPQACLGGGKTIPGGGKMFLRSLGLEPENSFS